MKKQCARCLFPSGRAHYCEPCKMVVQARRFEEKAKKLRDSAMGIVYARVGRKAA